MRRKNTERGEEFPPHPGMRMLRMRGRGCARRSRVGGQRVSTGLEMLPTNPKQKHSCLLSIVSSYSTVFREETTTGEDPHYPKL